MTQYPALVYGTLRPGCGNYKYFLDNKTISEEIVTIEGFTMRGERGYPYIVYGDTNITATLVHIHPLAYDKVLKSLDRLEGFHDVGNSNNHYDRVLHTFTMNGKEIQAWIYVASQAFGQYLAYELPVIKSGDWVAHVRSLT